MSAEGTLINKATLLKDATAALFGFGVDALPDDMFNALAHTGDLHVWKRTQNGQVDYPVSPNRNAYQEGTSGTTTIEYMGQLGNKVQMTAGSYAGTGKYGSSNPNTLTFPFEPKLVIVTGRTNTTADYQSMGIFVQGAQWTFGAGAGKELNTTVFSGNNGANQITWNGNTISWYTLCTATTENYRPAAQLNSSGRTYYYIAIG